MMSSCTLRPVSSSSECLLLVILKARSAITLAVLEGPDSLYCRAVQDFPCLALSCSLVPFQAVLFAGSQYRLSDFLRA